MAPKHPVPKGYGSPCVEGEIVTQGTGSGPVIFRYDEEEFDEATEHRDTVAGYNRHGRGFNDPDYGDNLFDC